MLDLQSSLADNLAEVYQNNECKICKPNLEYVAANGKLLTFRCKDCNKNDEKYRDYQELI